MAFIFYLNILFKSPSALAYANKSTLLNPPLISLFINHWYLILIFFLTILLLVLLIVYERKKHKRLRMVLESQNKEIVQQNEEIECQRDNLTEVNKEIYKKNIDILAQSEYLSKLNDQLKRKNSEIIGQRNELEKLSMVAKFTNNAILITNGEGEILWVNDAFTRIYGYTVDEFIAERGSNLKNVCSDFEICKLIETCLSTKKPITYNAEVFCLDGNKIWIQTSLTPVLNPDGSIKNVIAIDSDISALKDAEKNLISLGDEIYSQATEIMKQRDEITIQRDNLSTLNTELQQKNEEISAQHDYLVELNAELQQKNEEIIAQRDELEKTQSRLIQSEKMVSLGVLTAGIAHEINNPINFVYAGVNSITRDFEDLMQVINIINSYKAGDNAQEFLNIIEAKKQEYGFVEAIEAVNQTLKDISIGAERTAEIVEGLRNFSRSEREEWGSVNLHKTLDGVLLLLRNKYKNSIEVIKDYDPSINQVDGKAGKLNQAFMNIIANAIDAIDEKGVITVKTKKKGNSIIVSIIDTGKGIPKNVLSKIFDPFFTTKDIGKGVGLGLSITFGIIQEHTGTIEVTSNIGKGTEFLITLPEFQNLV
jgi:PAS domain S-box-containing protein